MRTLTLQQGSDAWLAHRRTTRNASDAPAMMGASPYISRSELVKRYATGVVPEVDAATQARFDKGHEVEPALRALAESIIGEDLYPVTGISDDDYLGASFDGVTLDESIIFEAKQTNAEKMMRMERGEIPPQDYWQIVSQFAVCDTADRCIYLVGDGTEDGTARLDIHRHEIDHEIDRLRASWAQFDADVAAYVPEETKPAPVAAVVEGFGALSLRIEGRVLASNLDAFKAGADAFIARLPKPEDLQTDQDFADADAAVKACEEAESRIKAATDAALTQMSDVDALLRTAKSISETIRTARLALDKAVKVEKENRRAQIVQAGVDAVNLHYRTINLTLGEFAMTPPASLRADLGAAIKGKRTISGLRDAIDAAVADEKIEASQTAERVRQCIAVLTDDAAGFEPLFADRRQLVAGKMPDDLRNLVAARIAEHQKRLEDERVRIRQEEADKIAREHREAQERQQQESQADEASAAAEATPLAVPPAAAPARMAGAAPMPAGARIKLGDINDWIAPLTITADGLATLGFKPSESKGAAKLYAANDFPTICTSLADVIARAPARAAQKKAA